jgi:small-conductance mechanosensitive channel
MARDWPEIVRSIFSEETAFTLALVVLVAGVVVSYLVWRWIHRFLKNVGVHDAVQGTPFERSVQSLGTSTVGIIATLSAIFVYIGAVIVAFNVSQLLEIQRFWLMVTSYLPRIFIATLAVIVGLITGEKAKFVVQNRLRSVKLPEAAIIPEIVKYSMYYIAALIALSQVGVATTALLVLLAAYAFGVVLLSAIAFKDLLAASAAGIYLLLAEPYTIGDEVRIDDKRGIVQEIDMFVTHIETNGEEYIIPNQQVFRSGIIRIRDD